MTNEDEKRLLLSIKTIPIILFTLIAIIGIGIALYINKVNFNEEIKRVQDVYVQHEKDIVKQEIIKLNNNILNETKLTKEKLKKNIKEKVLIAHTIATNIYNQYKQTKTNNEIKEIIKNALVNIRFNQGRGYFFIYSLDYECILLPVARNLEGSSFYNFKDGKGMYLTREIIKQVKQEKEGFLEWWYPKPNDKNTQYEKIGFNKYFEPLNWFIGTGEYVVDFEETVKQTITKRLSTYSYGKDSYIFVLDEKGTLLSHKNKDEIGKNKLNEQDRNGVKIAKEIFKVSNNGGGFIEYYYSKDNSKEPTKKISYVMNFKDWNWTIGSGFYTDDLDNIIEKKKQELIEENQRQIDTIMLVSFFILVIIIILSISLSYAIQIRFENYKEKVKQKDELISEQSKLAAMGEMLGNIAHQWRQPLSIISTGATGMQAQKEYGILDDQLFDKTCETINTNAQYLSKTIDDFKNFIKGDRVKSIFSLEQNINSFLHLVEGSIKSHDVKVILNIEKNIKVNGYENELIQCFINIFHNAKDALVQNKIENKIIMISAYTDNKNTIIEILDNGKGIDKKIIEKIYEPYFTTKHQSQGTGIGLNMTYKFIVEGMKGTITASNKNFEYNGSKYKGALFKISLPN
ncbi:MAG: cache domain-containing protein [Arcobacteraceae bacterium]